MFSKYKYVHALYKEESFTRAAEKLFISQPSLSAAVKGIEKNIGAPLFERTGTGVVPTDVGKIYIESVEKIVNIENECMKKINDIYNLETGSIAVGGTNYLSSYVFPKVANKFNALYPNISVTITEAHSDKLSEMLKNDEIDLMIDSFDENAEQYQGYPLINEKLILCVPIGREINKKLKDYVIYPEEIYSGKKSVDDVPAVPLDIFKEEGFIALKKGNDMYTRAQDIFRKADISPKITFSVDQMNVAYAMAESGTGLCFATDTLFKYGKFFNDIALYNIGDISGKRTLYIVHKKSRYCTRAMKKFIEVTEDMIK